MIKGSRLVEWLALYALSIFTALFLTAILVETTGGEWRPVMSALLDGSLRRPGRWGETLGAAAPLLLVALGTVIALWPSVDRRRAAGTGTSKSGEAAMAGAD